MRADVSGSDRSAQQCDGAVAYSRDRGGLTASVASANANPRAGGIGVDDDLAGIAAAGAPTDIAPGRTCARASAATSRSRASGSRTTTRTPSARDSSAGSHSAAAPGGANAPAGRGTALGRSPAPAIGNARCAGAAASARAAQTSATGAAETRPEAGPAKIGTENRAPKGPSASRAAQAPNCSGYATNSRNVASARCDGAGSGSPARRVSRRRFSIVPGCGALSTVEGRAPSEAVRRCRHRHFGRQRFGHPQFGVIDPRRGRTIARRLLRGLRRHRNPHGHSQLHPTITGV